MTAATARVPIRFDAWFKALARMLLIAPSDSFIELDDEAVSVHMAWGFRTRFPRSAIAAAARSELAPISRGVHGVWGTWLVNGSGDGILEIALQPAQRAWVVGFPVTLRKLLVSVDDPDALARRLRPA